MNIVFLLPDLKGGGAQKMIINMANEFAARGSDVTLITLGSAGQYRDHIESNVRYINFDKKRVALSFFELRRELLRINADIVLSALFHVNVMALLVKALTPHINSRFIITERNAFTARIKGSTKWIDKLYPFLVKHLYKRADKVIGISKGVTADITHAANLSPAQTATIYNPVITDKSKVRLNESLNDPHMETLSHPRLITSGRLVPQKDYPTLLKAFQEVLRRQPDATLTILGDGPNLPEVEALAHEFSLTDNIYMPGFVNNPLAYMKHADVFVISSRWEGFCNVIVEALYCGLPIVATDCPSGPAEILEDGKYGHLTTVDDAYALADAVLDALENKVDLDAQKARANQFTVAKICDTYETVINEVLKAP